jgi:hypothetical protein
MSLTSYRAAPPRVNLRSKPWLTGFKLSPTERAACAARAPDWRACFVRRRLGFFATCVLQTWQRPTLPRLETKYHQRWSVSRPSSEWDRVQPLRHNHQVGKAHVAREAVFCAKATFSAGCFGHKPASATARRRFSGALAEHRPVRAAHA